MTNHELLLKIQNEKSIDEFILAKQLIVHLSKNINNEVDLINKSSESISFKLKKFNKIFSKITQKNYPIQYVLNKTNFLDIDLYINKKTFIPRPETEYWLKYLFTILKDQKKKVLELCSGSGAISLALEKRFVQYDITCIEKSFWAIKSFKKNIKINNSKIKLIKGDFIKKVAKLDKKFNLVICNPPYISFNDNYIQTSLRYEPKKSLYAKDNGLFFYKKLISKLDLICSRNAQIILEIGFNQEKDIEKILTSNNIKNFSFIRDYNNNIRAVFFLRNRND